MNVNEIVKLLREYDPDCKGEDCKCPHCCRYYVIANKAADLIESMQAQLAERDKEIERLKDYLNNAEKQIQAKCSEIGDLLETVNTFRWIPVTERLREAVAWIPVTERLPEDDPDISKHSESHFEFCTVIATGFYAGSDKPSVSQTNRLINYRTGIEYIDREAKILDKWYWGSSFERITHWMPLPTAPEKPNAE